MVDLTMAALTYTLAVSLAPPNCHIASTASDFEELRLQAIGGGEGFVGAFKDIESAYYDVRNLASIEERREGWQFLSGETVSDDFWNIGQPGLVPLFGVEDTPSIGVYVGGGLNAESLTYEAPGAYYKCCYSVVPTCFDTDRANLENVLIPVVMNA